MTTQAKKKNSAEAEVEIDEIRMATKDLSVFYGDAQALFDINLDIHTNKVTALIGPSGCGKSTFIRCLNRMNDFVEGCRVAGKVTLDGFNIYDRKIDTILLRQRIGMVFQKPNPFPKSIYENVAYGPKIHRLTSDKDELDALVEKTLKRVGLWDEVEDRLTAPGTSLSGGQQQRLCIARAIATKPEVVLMDEPCSALDPIATARIEELIAELRRKFTIVIITHSMQQAERVSDHTAFFHLGKIMESGTTEQIFNNPENPKTKDYIRREVRVIVFLNMHYIPVTLTIGSGWGAHAKALKQWKMQTALSGACRYRFKGVNLFSVPSPKALHSPTLISEFVWFVISLLLPKDLVTRTGIQSTFRFLLLYPGYGPYKAGLSNRIARRTNLFFILLIN